MVIDEVQHWRHGEKRPQESQDEDDEPLVFKHIKKTNVEDASMISEDKEESIQRKNWGMDGPSNLHSEVWEEVWDEDLARVFHEHHQTQDEEARAGGRLREPKIEEDAPNNVDNIKLIPRINIDSIVGESSEVANWDYPRDEVDVYTPLTWEEIWDLM